MNKGIKVATGDIIGILNSDDIYYPEALNYVNKYFNEYENIDFLFGSVHKHKLMHGFSQKNKMDIWFILPFDRFFIKGSPI